MIRYCKGCGIELTDKQKIFCGHLCQARYALKNGRRDPTGKHWHWNEESRRQRSIKMKGQLGFMKGKKWKEPMTPEEKERHRILSLGRKLRPKTAEERKAISKMQKTKIGPLAPNWQDGKSFEPYAINFNKQLRDKIKLRDEYQCKLCGASKEESKLAIHHIDYDKLNSNNYNLITLCISCNSKVNKNRNFYTKLFKMFEFYWYEKEKFMSKINE